jgi:hypothetical protein
MLVKSFSSPLNDLETIESRNGYEEAFRIG